MRTAKHRISKLFGKCKRLALRNEKAIKKICLKYGVVYDGFFDSS